MGACPLLKHHLYSCIDFMVASHCVCNDLLAAGPGDINHPICIDFKIHEKQAQVAPQGIALPPG